MGEYEEYRPKKWTDNAHKNLRLILRDQYAPKPAITVRQKQEGDRSKEADLRCIITNIPTEDDGKCGQLWRATSAAIYEDLYCRRGSACELKFHELKDESRAQRASATRFLTNFYRLLLSAIAYTIFVDIRLKIFSRFEYKGRWWNVSVERMRRALLNIAGLVKSLKSSKAPTNYFTPNILRKSWSRLVVSVVHLDALAFPVAAT